MPLRHTSRLLPLLFLLAAGLNAQSRPVEVDYAGSMGPLVDRGLKPAAAQALGLEIRGRAQGAYGLAHLIAAGSLRPDVFISVTAGPMRILFQAGKAGSATAIARTEMVIAYNPSGRFAAQLARAGRAGAPAWRQVLAAPGFRFGRTNPLTDPQGRNILIVMKLEARRRHDPGLPRRILGPAINPRQIFPEAEIMARLQSGQLDASSAYRFQPIAFHLPFVSLPPAINLGDPAHAREYESAALRLAGRVYHAEPLVFYAAQLRAAPHPRRAGRFLAWLRGPAAQAIMARFGFQPPPPDARLAAHGDAALRRPERSAIFSPAAAR